MKKKFFTLMTVALLGLTSCGGGATTATNPTTTAETTPTTTENTSPDITVTTPEKSKITLTPGKEVYEVERLADVTIKVTVTSEDPSLPKTLNFTSEQDGDIIDLPDNTQGVPGSLKVHAKKIGEATVVATSVADPNVSVSIKVVVKKRLSALKTVWGNLIKNNNYTIDVTRNLTEAEVEALGGIEGVDEDTRVPYSTISVTEKAVTNIKHVIDENKISTATTLDDVVADAYWLTNKNTGNSYVGIGVDKNNNAFDLLVDSEGKLVEPGEVLKTSLGLLNGNNFAGAGVDASTANDVGTFFGLQAINPNWLSSKKTDDNVYEIVGSESDTSANNLYVETLLFEMLDLGGFYDQINAGVTSFSGLAAVYETTITVLDGELIQIDLYNETQNLTATISGIGETAALDGLDTYLATAEAKLPTLVTALQDAMDAVNGNDYVMTRNLYKKNKETGEYDSAPYYCFYNKNYLLVYYGPEYAKLFGKDQAVSGYIKKADGIHEINYTFPETEGEQGTFNVGEVLEGTAELNLWQVQFDPANGVSNYASTMALFTEGLIYNLGETPAEVFTGYGQWYYCKAQNVFEDISNWYVGEADKAVSYIAGVSVSYAKETVDADDGGTKEINVVSEVGFLAASSADGSSYSLFAPKLSGFGKTAKLNPFHEQVMNLINPTDPTNPIED